MKTSDNQSKEERKAKKLQKEELDREIARETVNSVIPLFIEKAKKKLIFFVIIFGAIAIMNEFVLKLNSDAPVILAYAVVAAIAYAFTRKEWKEAKHDTTNHK